MGNSLPTLLQLTLLHLPTLLLLQFCFWDQLKELAGMEVRRLTNLARLMATVLAAGALPPKMLKVVWQYRQLVRSAGKRGTSPTDSGSGSQCVLEPVDTPPPCQPTLCPLCVCHNRWWILQRRCPLERCSSGTFSSSTSWPAARLPPTCRPSSGGEQATLHVRWRQSLPATGSMPVACRLMNSCLLLQPA